METSAFSAGEFAGADREALAFGAAAGLTHGRSGLTLPVRRVLEVTVLRNFALSAA